VPLSSAQRSARQGPYPYYGAQGVIDFIDDFIFDGRFILVPEDGENLRSRKLPIAYFAEGQFWVNNHAHIIKAKPGIANDRFVQSGLQALDIGAFVTGAAQPKLSQANLRQIPLLLPTLEHQETVAGVFDAVDDLIENNRRRVEVLEEMARAIYREWFVHFRYPGHEDAIFVHSPLGRIPEGWAVRPFAEIGSFVNGFAFKSAQWSDDGRPIIKIKQLKQGIATDTPRCDEAEVDEKFWVEQGDLLFSWSADLGVYRWAEEPGLLNQHLFTVRPSGDLTLTFLFHALDESMPQFWNRAQGTTMRHIKRAALSEVATVAPPTDLLDRFTATVEPMTQEVIALKQSNSHLASIQDLLLPMLVTGQIDVSSLDVDVLVEGAAVT